MLISVELQLLSFCFVSSFLWCPNYPHSLLLWERTPSEREASVCICAVPSFYCSVRLLHVVVFDTSTLHNLELVIYISWSILFYALKLKGDIIASCNEMFIFPHYKLEVWRSGIIVCYFIILGIKFKEKMWLNIVGTEHGVIKHILKAAFCYCWKKTLHEWLHDVKLFHPNFLNP